MLEEESVSSAAHEETHYRSVSPLAIIGFGLGLVSALALAHPLMWWLPFAAVIVSLAAGRAIRKSHGALTGQKLAVAAICLSVFFLSWAVTRVFAGERIHQIQARSIAERWLSVVKQGDQYRAHQWTLSPFRRQRSGVSLNEFYAGNADARKDFEKFETSVLGNFAELDAEDQIEYRTTEITEGDPSRRFVLMVFDWHDNGGEVRPIKVGVERWLEGESNVVLWQILSIEPA